MALGLTLKWRWSKLGTSERYLGVVGGDEDQCDADVVVVGGGHNGLIAASYLARAGVSTLLVEARDTVGGCASTVTDLGARFNICNCDHTTIRAMPILDELDLANFGLKYLELEASSVHITHDQRDPWVFYHDVDQHLEALSRTHPHWVQSYRRYLNDALPVARLVLEMARTVPSTQSFLRRVALMKGRGARRVLQWSRMSANEVYATYFDDWRTYMPAIVTGPTVWGVHPNLPGTGLAGALFATKHVARTGRPEGGSGALTEALHRAFTAADGDVILGDAVTRIHLNDGAVSHVELASGRRIRANRVLAACDPQRVFADWLADVDSIRSSSTAVRWRERPVDDGYESKLDVIVSHPPTYRHAHELESRLGYLPDILSPTTIVCPTPEQLESAHTLRSTGGVATSPSMLVNMPTVLDQSMQLNPDEHVLSLEVLFTPYSHPWSTSTEPERWLGLLEKLCEPDTLNVLRWRSMTPDRYEREFFMHRGHTPAYAGSPLATLRGTPRDVTRHVSDIPGLYLSGAAAFPGAGIFGGSGRNAAHRVLDDLGKPLVAG